MPLYHTRAMRCEFLHLFGTVTNTKGGNLREAYRRLTGDSSAAHDSDKKEVDRRIGELLDLQMTYWWYWVYPHVYLFNNIVIRIYTG